MIVIPKEHYRRADKFNVNYIEFFDVAFKGKSIGNIAFTDEEAYKFYKMLAQNDMDGIKRELRKAIEHFLLQ